jgi:hypothetical protein
MFADRPPKRLKALNVLDADEATMEYFDKLPCVLPATVADLINYLRVGEPAAHPFHCSQALTDTQHWKASFVEKACHSGEQTSDRCETLEEILLYFAVTPNDVTNNSEMTMVPLIDAALQLLVLFAQVKRDRNVTHNTTSAGKKPDYYIAKNHTIIVRGEDKLRSKYNVGVYGHDPVFENVEKTPWGRWKEFYGDTPYILSYACIGDSSATNITIGVLDASSQSFMPLFKYNIASSIDRPKFSLEILKLIPVLKGIIRAADSVNQSLMTTPLVRIQQELGIEKKISVVVHDREPIVEMKWTLRNRAQMEAMLARLGCVFACIDRLQDSTGYIRIVPELGLHISQDATLIEFKGFFSPYGQQLRLASFKDVIDAVSSVAASLGQLHIVGVIHNDVRWANIVQLTNSADASVKYVIIDFDDAFVLNETTPVCPALMHLARDGHSPRTFEPHGREVDIWSLGYLLYSHPLTEHNQHARQIANDIMTNYTTKSILDITQMLASL